MKIHIFSIHRAYEIRCKLFVPVNTPVRHLILGVHGFAGDKESSVLEALARECRNDGVALLCFDFPAHGTSPVDETMLSVQNCKEDLLAVAAYGAGLYPQARKSIFATSFGGYISLLCYEQLPEFTYVLRAPAITMPQLLTQRVLCITTDAFREQGYADCGFERPIRLPYAFHEELQDQPLLMSKAYPRPMLIIHGDRDDIVPPEVIEEFTEKHPAVQLVMMPGADHRFKNPGELDAIVVCVRKFLQLCKPGKSKSPGIHQAVYDYLARIPRGNVVTYGQIARYLGNPRLARTVGNILHQNPDGDRYPCYKVVNAQGKLAEHYAFGGIRVQRQRLEADGIPVDDNRVELVRFQWQDGHA